MCEATPGRAWQKHASERRRASKRAIDQLLFLSSTSPWPTAPGALSLSSFRLLSDYGTVLQGKRYFQLYRVYRVYACTCPARMFPIRRRRRRRAFSRSLSRAHLSRYRNGQAGSRVLCLCSYVLVRLGTKRPPPDDVGRYVCTYKMSVAAWAGFGPPRCTREA